MDQGNNPFQKIWNTVGTIGGVLSLSSLSQDLIDFPAFVDLLIAKYQSWVYPVFEFLFAWLPFDVPTSLYDYLVLGLLWFSSMLRAASSMPLAEFSGSVKKEVLLFVLHCLLWPVSVGLTAYTMYIFKQTRIGNDGGLEGYIYECHWRSVQYLLAVILLFALLVIGTMTYSTWSH